jgi:DNA-binding SARP family transcriptional activator
MATRAGARHGHNGVLELSLLDAFELRRDGCPLRVAPAVQRVVALLALGGCPMDRTQVAGVLWTEYDEQRATANLRSALWRLRAHGGGVVVASHESLMIDTGVEVDASRVEALARRAIAGDEVACLEAPRVLRKCGDLLPGWYDDWVLIEREEQRRLRLRGLERACEVLTTAGRFDEAADAGCAAVALDGLRESAHRALIRLHLAIGNEADALRQYALFTGLIGASLGLAPSPQIDRLVAHLRTR